MFSFTPPISPVVIANPANKMKTISTIQKKGICDGYSRSR
ncbi:hypothetical protein ATN83_4972 [Raoultella ornithinolytica]|nr:hypothetical protein ATN83_4972 [Raoultella ornithinolytica]KDV89560.1 hypothetical protein AB00_5181 [Raoultella ornithinolytica 2-156-04_S1_C1]KDX09341.1 hypothetical protein AB28_5172 [Raoultella ornithinolytica 2-156-04_S1_C2]